MKAQLIIDTGIFLAILSKTDQYHKAALEAMQRYQESHDFVTTWPVLTEVAHLLQRRAASQVPAFIRSFEQGAFDVFDLNRSHASRITQLMEKYAELPMDLADASLVILAESLGHGNILSTDQRDFRSYRWKQREPFHNFFQN